MRQRLTSVRLGAAALLLETTLLQACQQERMSPPAESRATPVAAAQRTASRWTASAEASASGVSAGSAAAPLPLPRPPQLRLADRRAQQGLFHGEDNNGVRYRVGMAVRAAPQRHRRALAFARLATAVGCADAVADTRMWRLPINDVAALTADANLISGLLPRLAVDHDGRVVTLFEAMPAGRELSTESPELARVRQLAGDTAAIPAAQLPLVRGWVCVRALDYISGHVVRTQWWLNDRATRLLGIGNEDALPGYVDPAATRQVLDELAAVEHFPAALYQALVVLPRAQLLNELEAETFVDRVLGPRQRADVADRMATVASLMHARMQQRGRQQALSL